MSVNPVVGRRGGWNGGRKRTLSDGYGVDVAGHDEVCGFVDTSDSKFLVREFVGLGIRSGARERIKDRKNINSRGGRVLS